MNTMKRFLGIILAVSLIFCVAISFASCSITIPDYTEEEDKAPATECTHVDGCTCNLGGEEEDDEDETPAPITPAPTTPAKVNYTVMVVNTKGVVVPGVKVHVGAANGKTEAPKTTDANGLAVFTLTEGNGYYAQINELPEYTYENDDVVGFAKVSFDNYNVAVIEVDQAVEYTVSVWGDVVEGISVSVYEKDGTEPVAEGVTDENGEFVAMLREGFEYAIFAYVQEPVYIEAVMPMEITVGEDGVYGCEVWTSVERDGSEAWPYILEENTIYAYVPADETMETWYSVRAGENDTLTVNNPLATVKIGDTVISAEDGADSVVVALGEYAEYGVVTFAICYNNVAADEETTTEDVEFKATVAGPAGSFGNPIIVDSLADIPTVSVEGGENSVVYYAWVADTDCELIVKWDNADAIVNITSYTDFDSRTSDAYDGYAIVSVKAYDTVKFEIGTEGSYDADWNYIPAPAGDINVECFKYITYEVVLNDADFNIVANAVVEVMDEYGVVIASACTDMLGRASFKLLEGAYTVTAGFDYVPSGYKCSAAELIAGEVAYPYFYEFPSSDPSSPSPAAPGDFGYLLIDLLAGKTGYFVTRGQAGKMLVIEGVNADTVLSLGYYDFETEEWVVTETIAAVGVEEYGWITYTISVLLPEDPNAFIPAMAENYFAITNGSDEDIQFAIAYESVGRYEGGGSFFDPYILPEAGDHVADVPMYNSAVFKYTATETGTLTVTTPDGAYNVTIEIDGEVVGTTWPEFEGTPAQSVSVSVEADAVVMISIQTTNGMEAEVNFTLAVVAAETNE